MSLPASRSGEWWWVQSRFRATVVTRLSWSLSVSRPAKLPFERSPVLRSLIRCSATSPLPPDRSPWRSASICLSLPALWRGARCFPLPVPAGPSIFWLSNLFRGSRGTPPLTGCGGSVLPPQHRQCRTRQRDPNLPMPIDFTFACVSLSANWHSSRSWEEPRHERLLPASSNPA